MIDFKLFDAAWQALPSEFKQAKIAAGLVLGSGWRDAVRPDKIVASVSYAALPGLGASTVQGHAGELHLFEKCGKSFLAFMGRRHWYEGVGWEPVVLPIELLRRLGVARVLLTNAAGGVALTFKPGDFMIVKDHINTLGLSPLQGARVEGWGERFPDLSRVYGGAMTDALRQAAQAVGLPGHEGVYAFTCGPTYETPAEVQAYARMGADAVGMSTVPEAIVAAAAGFDVAAVSCITNMAARADGSHLSHHEVLAQSQISQGMMLQLMDALLERLS